MSQWSRGSSFSGRAVVCSREGVPGWVYRGGYTGWVIPGTPSQLESGAYDSEAGPGSPRGAGVGGHMHSARPSTQNPPSGPGPARTGHSLVLGPLPASWPIRVRLTSFYSKVSQNDEVSPKYTHKACHSPYSQNGS